MKDILFQVIIIIFFFFRQQTVPLDELILAIPHVFKRTGESYDPLPTWMYHKENVRLVRVEDEGPGTHLYTCVREISDPEAVFIVVDDDQFYNASLVSRLLSMHIATSEAVAASGHISAPGISHLRPPYLQDTKGYGGSCGPVLVSYLGVLYRRHMFDDSLFNFTGFESCYNQDEVFFSKMKKKCESTQNMVFIFIFHKIIFFDFMKIWIAAHLARKGFRRRILDGALGVESISSYHLESDDSLTRQKGKESRSSVNYKCNRALMQAYSNLWGFRLRRAVAITISNQFDINVIAEKLMRQDAYPDVVYMCQDENYDFEMELPHLSDQLTRNKFRILEGKKCRSNSISALLQLLLWLEHDPQTMLIQMSDFALMHHDNDPTIFENLIKCSLESHNYFCHAGQDGFEISASQVTHHVGMGLTEAVMPIYPSPEFSIFDPPLHEEL